MGLIAKLDDVLLKTYGVDNSGRLDSSAAFTKLFKTYTSVYLPEGVYLLGDVILKGVHLYGEGTILKNASAEHAFIVQSNSIISGLTFNSQVNGTQRSEIKLDEGAENVRIYECTFTGSLYSAISADVNGDTDQSLTYTYPASNVVITDNEFRGYSRALYLHSVKDIVISNNTFKQTTRDAIRLRQATGSCSIVNNLFKNIGEPVSIAERPKNWSSLSSYNLGDIVSVPPYGIYQARINSTTIGSNPATSGSSEWTLLDGGYFETKDAVDAYWSGRELVISNNVIDTTYGFGFDIKGSEPTGKYSVESVIIDSNMITNCFGVGINFHSADLLQDGKFRYASNCIISRNIIKGCNAERYDVSQSAINLRQGCSNVTISDNHIKNHFGRGIAITNLQEGSGISRSIKVSGNQVLDCGIAGHPGNIGLNVSAVDGLIIKDNIIENTNFQKEYELVVSGNVDQAGPLLIPTSISRSDINVDLTGLSTIPQVLTAIKNEMDSIQFPDDPSLTNIYYYEKVEASGGATATLRYQDLLATSLVSGASGNNLQFELVQNNTIATGVYVGAVTVVGNKVTLTVRTSATMGHAVSVFNTYGPAAGATSLMSLQLAPGTPTDIASQLVTVATPPLNLSGGVDDDRVTFFARAGNTFSNTQFPITVGSLSVSLVKNEQFSNSVNKLGINLKGEELIGSTNLVAGIGKVIVKDNIVRNNASEPRFEILYDNNEIKNPIAYVTSDNRYNNTTVTTLARTAFSGGANSSSGVSVKSIASITTQGMTLKARKAGVEGNSIYLTIAQGVGNSVSLSVSVAAFTTVSGYEVGGTEIVITLPTNSSGVASPVGVKSVESALRSALQQSILSIRDNILE